MIRETLPNSRDAEPSQERLCSLAQRWGIRFDLARRLVAMSQRLEFPVQIISGSRSRTEQTALLETGRPTARFELSTHANEFEDGSCRLATGADLSPLVAHVGAVRARMGAEAVFAGLRWGGGSQVDPSTGIPSDWQHVDLGPRSTHP